MNSKNYTRSMLMLVPFIIMGHSALAIKIVVPDQYKDQVEEIKNHEFEQRELELQGGASSVPADEGIAIAGQTEVEEEASLAPAADAFLIQSVVEATATAAEFEGTLEADQGMVSGQIVDQESGEPLSGVAILIEGADVATVTAEDGRYSIGPVSEGVYTLSFIKSGYIEANVTDYSVVGGEVSVFPFALPPRPAEMSDEVYELQDFTVTAEQANEMILQLDLQKLSITQLDVLSADEFSKYAASDVADAIKNISGVSLSDGKYAVIRGLNDRYTVTRLSGNTMPSPDPDRAAVPLDVFPTGIFESIETRKTYSADLPAHASGGVIDLKIVEMPEERIVKFSTKIGMNSESQDEWLSSGFGGTADYFGLGADDRSSASLEDLELAFNYSQDPSGAFAAWQDANNNKLLGLDQFSIASETPAYDYGFSVLYGDRFEFKKGLDLGIVIAAQQSSESRYKNATISSTSASVDYSGAPSDFLVTEWDGTREVGTFEGRVSGLVGLSVNQDDVNEVSFNALFTRTGIEEVIINEGGTTWATGDQGSSGVTFDDADDDDDGIADPDLANGSGTGYYRSSYTERSMDAYILNWAHTNPNDSWLDTANLSLMFSKNEQDEPLTFDTQGEYDAYLYSRLTEQSSTGLSADATLRLLDWEDNVLKFKLGAYLDQSTRDFTQEEQHYTKSSSSYYDSGSGTVYLVTEGGWNDDGVTGKANGERDISAFYGMLDYELSDKVVVSAGLRRVNSALSYDGYGSAPQAGDFTPEVVDLMPIDDADWVNSINVNVNITDELKLRGSLSKTIARPTYRELQPFPIMNTLTNEVEVGNPGYLAQVSSGVENAVIASEYADYRGLEIADVENFDLRLEYYTKQGGFLAFGYFKKQVGNPIERVEAFGQSSDVAVYTYVNNENEADLSGIEIEWQQNIGDLFNVDGLRFLSVGGNYTQIDAVVHRSAIELAAADFTGSVDSDLASDTRALYDQPDMLANLFLTMSFESIGSEITLSANHTGERLTGVLSSASSDIYEEAVTTLNLVYSQDIPWVEGLNVKFSVKNLTDPYFRRTTKRGDNQVTISDESGEVVSEYTLEEYKKGLSYSISMSYAF
jgi:outer membrane receptor protein involved in Fe transport